MTWEVFTGRRALPPAPVEPVVCTCAVPSRDPIGECRQCRRPVVDEAFLASAAAGLPSAPALPGAAVPVPSGPRPTAATPTLSGGGQAPHGEAS